MKPYGAEPIAGVFRCPGKAEGRGEAVGRPGIRGLTRVVLWRWTCRAFAGAGLTLLLAGMHGCTLVGSRAWGPFGTQAGERARVDASTLEASIDRAREFLLERQHPDGYWQGFLENDSSATGQYLLLMYYLGRVEEERSRKAIAYLKRCRDSQGGWVAYPGGPVSLDVTVINYVALAASGVPEEDKEMEKTRTLVATLGGLEKVNFFTKIFLAFYGVVPLECVPGTTTRVFENRSVIYRQGFARTIFIPYMVLYETGSVRDVSDKVARALQVWGRPERGSQERLFQGIFENVSRIGGLGPSSETRRACLEWIAQHQEEDGTWAGIFQVTLFSLMALHADGDRRWQEAIEKGVRGVHSYQKETDDEIIQQFSVSPVMDTAYAVQALRMAGVGSDSDPLRRAVQWLMGKQCLKEGDWKHNNPEGVPGGWSFEFHNTWYPDLDSTSMVLNAMTYLEEADRQRHYGQIDRGVSWVLSMQNWDGGFAVWDKNNWLVFKMLSGLMDVGDYSHSDITARVVISLARLQAIDRYRNRGDLGGALRAAEWFLWRHQQSFQRWQGRWGVNYTYGTGQVLEALAATGMSASHILIAPSVAWLVSVQNPDGGWGESIESYERGQFVPAESTIAQTATVLKGLIAVRAREREAIDKGVTYLLGRQLDGGNWEDHSFFAVNIPKAWYGRYELIPTLYATIALCAYRDRYLAKASP